MDKRADGTSVGCAARDQPCRHGAASEGDLRRLRRQSRRVVRLLRLLGLRAVFRQIVLPLREPDGAAPQCGGHLRRRVPHASLRRLAVRARGRPARSASGADDIGADDVRRLAHHRGDADLRDDRHRGAVRSAFRTPRAGPEPRRRVRHQRHISERGGASGAPRLLFQLPVRDADRRPAARHARAAVSAKSAADAGAARRVGLAHSLLHRRRARCRRLFHAPRYARERSLPRGARAGPA